MPTTREVGIRYEEFREAVREVLIREHDGLTWRELREAADLPYERACPTWTARLEREIGLERTRGRGRAHVWRLLRGTPGREDLRETRG